MLSSRDRARQWLDQWAPALDWNTTMLDSLTEAFEASLVQDRESLARRFCRFCAKGNGPVQGQHLVKDGLQPKDSEG